MAATSVRWRQNIQAQDHNKMRRRPGWSRLFKDRFATDSGDNCFCPSNYDLHDQLLPLQLYREDLGGGACSSVRTRTQGREPITMLRSIDRANGGRVLLVGTQSRVYSLNESTGNWRIIGDGFGGGTISGVPARRFRAAALNDTVILTNDYDTVQYHDIGQPVEGCGMQAMNSIPELEDDMKVTRARVVASFNGVVLLMNVVQDGVHQPSRIRWCGLNQPQKWISPDPETIAGFLDLDYGETILAASPLGGSMIIYTDRSIWSLTATGSSSVFTAVRLYNEPKERNGCLLYPNSLASSGDAHYYAGRDGVYRWNQYSSAPERVEWMHKSTGVMFDNDSTKVDPDVCEQVVGSFRTERKEYWLSWPRAGDAGNPSYTLVFNTLYGITDIVDAGFTALTNYRSDTRITLREWLIQYCICTLAELLPEFEKEGLPSSICAGSCALPTPPTTLYTSTGFVHDPDIQDWTQNPDPDSLCALLGDVRIDDFCGDCQEQQVFIGAASADWCLKEIGASFNREVCNNAATGTGSFITLSDESQGYCPFEGDYQAVGYNSILRGTFALGGDVNEKLVKKVYARVFPSEQASPPSLKLRIGTTQMPLDPNPSNPFSVSGQDDDPCAVPWFSQQWKTLECPAQTSSGDQVANNQRAVMTFMFKIHRKGIYIHYELSIVGWDGTNETPALGGEADLSSLIVETLSLPERQH